MKRDDRHSQLLASPGGKLLGSTTIPGDKSLSHRAAMLGAIAAGSSHIRNWLAAGDTEATLGAMRDLGARIERHDANTLTIHGGELRQADQALDLKNAGTGIRLLAGIMVGQPFPSVLDGSEQLRRRPMKRITAPLQSMGAQIESTYGCCPLRIQRSQLRGTTYELPVASAQVKSAILLAALFADAPTTVIQPGPTRDHTERMLRSMGVRIDIDDENHNRMTLHPPQTLEPLDLTIPGDFSSGAFLLVAGLLTPDSDLTVTGVNLNPTRTGLLDVLEEMDADISTTYRTIESGEMIGEIRVRTSALKGIEIGGETVVRMIDEFPILMVAALRAHGETIVRDARELRVKETDRIAVMAGELRKMGAEIEEREDGFRILGPQQLSGADVDGHDDHRIAMSMTIAGTVASGETLVTDAACVADSFPGFAETLIGCGAHIEPA
ncbi:MAG: 3-phosphoshikimate 1-carboxyvinyltransferase [Chloroflexota bacterium]|nr:3-phosphoshikimate 1-carboxyvinyltransferase [Chloroflexota bacterium]